MFDVDVDTMSEPEQPSSQAVDTNWPSDDEPSGRPQERQIDQQPSQERRQDFQLPTFRQEPRLSEDQIVQRASTAATDEIDRRMAADREREAIRASATNLGRQLDAAAESGDLATYHQGMRGMQTLYYKEMLKYQQQAFAQIAADISKLEERFAGLQSSSEENATQREFDRELSLRPDLGPAVQQTAQRLVQAYQAQGSQDPQADANAFIAHAWETALSNGVSPLETLAEIGKNFGVQARRPQAPPPSLAGPAAASTPRRRTTTTMTPNPWADALAFDPTEVFAT